MSQQQQQQPQQGVEGEREDRGVGASGAAAPEASALDPALYMADNFEPQPFSSEERFMRWPCPANVFGPYREFALAVLEHRENGPSPFMIEMPSELYLHIKKTQKHRDAMQDVDLANMSGDNFRDDDIPWPDYQSVMIPPISEDQLEGIGYNIDETDDELTGPIMGPAMADSDFIFQKLELEEKRTAEDPLEDLPMDYQERRFFSDREESFATAMRAGQAEGIPPWAHHGFYTYDEETVAEFDREKIAEGLRDYDDTYRANYLNSDFNPEQPVVPPSIPGAMTNWYRKGPVGRGPKPPPRPDIADRLAEDYRWLLEDDSLDKAKDNGDVQMGGMGDIGGRRAASDLPGPSGYNSGSRSGAVSTNTPKATTNAPGPSGYNSGTGRKIGMNSAAGPSGYNSGASGRSGVSSAAGPSGYNSGSASRNTFSMGVSGGRSTLSDTSTPSIYSDGFKLAARATPVFKDPTADPTTYHSGIPTNLNTGTINEVQSRGLTHQTFITSEATSESTTTTPTKKPEHNMQSDVDLVISTEVTKRGISRGSDDEDWEPEKKQKGNKKVTPKVSTPRNKKSKDLTPKAAAPKTAVPNPFKTATPKAKNPKPATPKAATPTPAISSTPKPTTRKPTLKKSISGESDDGNWEPDDDDDLYDA
ncbi:hypothetical protein NHQ30_007702 [Ciborinia camelliae]|nr:hypothetical protein NHQ30_007702 [Ciborinia camelliae]